MLLVQKSVAHLRRLVNTTVQCLAEKRGNSVGHKIAEAAHALYFAPHTQQTLCNIKVVTQCVWAESRNDLLFSGVYGVIETHVMKMKSCVYEL